RLMAELTRERLQELRRIAEAVTPGPWAFPHQKDPYGCYLLPLSENNASYIAAFDPTTVLALLERIDALEAENERLRQIEAAARTLVDTAFEVPGPDEYVYQAVRVDRFDMLAALLKGEGGATHA